MTLPEAASEPENGLKTWKKIKQPTLLLEKSVRYLHNLSHSPGNTKRKRTNYNSAADTTVPETDEKDIG